MNEISFCRKLTVRVKMYMIEFIIDEKITL